MHSVQVYLIEHSGGKVPDMLTRRRTVWNTQHPTHHPIYSSQDKYIHRQRKHIDKEKYIDKEKWIDKKNNSMEHLSPYLLIYKYINRQRKIHRQRNIQGHRQIHLKMSSNLLPSDLPEKVRISTVQESPLLERPLYLRWFLPFNIKAHISI